MPNRSIKDFFKELSSILSFYSSSKRPSLSDLEEELRELLVEALKQEALSEGNPVEATAQMTPTSAALL